MSTTAFKGKYRANLAESMGAGRSPHAMPAPAAAVPPSRLEGVERNKEAVHVPLDKIAPDPGQPRKEFAEAELRELAESVKDHGQLQNIVLRWSQPHGVYFIVVGERRYRAHVLAGKSTIAAIIIDPDTPLAKIREMQLVENAQRQDLKPIEKAKAYREVMETNGWTGARLAEALKLDPGTISRTLALLDLPDPVKVLVEAGDLSPSKAAEIASKVEAPEDQVAVAAEIVDGNLNRERAAKAIKARSPKAPAKGKPKKITARSFRTPGGPRVTVEWGKGLTPESVVEALRAALAEAEKDAGQGGE